MFKLRRGRAQALVVALWLGAFLLLSCQPAQPVATPEAGGKPAATAKPAEKAAATAKPAEKAAETPIRGGTLRIDLTEPVTLDPRVSGRGFPPNSIYNLLIEMDDKGNLTKEGLFKDWTISPDGKTFTFKLQGGVKFHDGTDLDAAAVKAFIEGIKDPATKSNWATLYASVASVEVVDNLTVRLNLKAPDPLLLPRMSQEGGLVVSPAAVKKYGADYGRNPVGSGPFQFVEWKPGDRISFKRFEGYWKKDQAGNQLPYLDGLTFQVSTDPTVSFANLRTGQVDAIYYGVAWPAELLRLLKADANLTYIAERLINNRGVSINPVRPPFDNKAVRQAVVLALDRQGIVSALGETASPVDSVLDPKSWAYDGKAGVFPARDLAKAKAKMAEAGYPSGGLKVTITSGTDPAQLIQAQIVKANLAEIGIEAEIEVLASAANTAKTGTVGGIYQIAVTGAPVSIGIPDPGHTFGTHYHSKGTRNYLGPYSNAKVDELLDKAGSIYDQKERAALYREAASIIADDAVTVAVFGTNVIYSMNKKVRDFPPNAMQFFVGLDRTWLAK